VEVQQPQTVVLVERAQHHHILDLALITQAAVEVHLNQVQEVQQVLVAALVALVQVEQQAQQVQLIAEAAVAAEEQLLEQADQELSLFVMPILWLL
jgi:hypothetical protein